MTTLEQLLILNARQSLDLIKTGVVLAETVRQLAETTAALATATEAIRHYGPACERCGWNAARCDVHHRKPKGAGGLHTLENAIVLCPNCHRVEHEGGPR